MKKYRFKTISMVLPLLLAGGQQAFAFCGCFVRKEVKRADQATGAGPMLYNKSSQVIIVRDGERTVVTMSSDYEGDAKDFAMIVPVPEVLRKSDIRVVQQYIFQKIDAYTAPRMVEKWESDPCFFARMPKGDMIMSGKDNIKGDGGGGKSGASYQKKMEQLEQALGIDVDAKYTVGEYDIVILGAKESEGLKIWLQINGYKLPKGADEVLDPYIKEGMKFFVAKVNLKEQRSKGLQTLRPLQIQYNSPRFMLPIRLGMANSKGTQDMTMYAFTRKGRVEASNYRTVKLPTDRDIPLFIRQDTLFHPFCEAVFRHTWENEGKNIVMLEHAWDLSAKHSPKCAPCVAEKLKFADLREAGIWWVDSTRSGNYTGDLFVTRLHVRYDRKTFPQDLQFTNTPDQSSFQARYVIRHHAVTLDNCPEGKQVKRGLPAKHRQQLETLTELTGWDATPWEDYVHQVAWRRPKTPIVIPMPIDTPEVVVDVDSGRPSDTTLVDEAQSVKESEQFLANGDKGGGLSTKVWLMIVAGAMFVTGILVRVLGRKSKPKE